MALNQGVSSTDVLSLLARNAPGSGATWERRGHE